MEILDVNIQFSLIAKSIIAYIANNFFTFSMNEANVLIFVFITGKAFFTNFTDKILPRIFFHFLENDVYLKNLA